MVQEKARKVLKAYNRVRYLLILLLGLVVVYGLSDSKPLIMNMMYMGITIFLIILAVFDLIVGVSNDAVNFLNSAIGARAARLRTIIAVAAIGVFAGAALSNGMMDVARHGIMTPAYFSFYDVMCVFLAVMVTDVVLLDAFNTLGMPTSTTVSMVFELLGGSFAIALIHILSGDTDAAGAALSLGDMLNTEKALSVILGIFLSVAVAFVFGAVVQWIARIIFTFTYRVNGTTTDAEGRMGGRTSSAIKIGVFGGIAVTCIIWFLLINGMKGSSIMTPELKAFIQAHTWAILGGGCLAFSLVMSVLSALKVPVLKFVVLFGTFALAMAFAGNDLVNFVGVPLTSLEAYLDYSAHGQGDATEYMMQSLMGSAQTPTLYLVLAGVVMVLSLVFSPKAQNVVKTTVDLSRQDEGDEMFGSSSAARLIVRHSHKMTETLAGWMPRPVMRWVDARFNPDGALLAEGAAFDLIRAAVNLVLAGVLVAIGTSMKLPLSTTYVTFMVAMGTSLADRAWSRESAVFRITGVLSVIGGWFFTAAAAFVVCYLVATALYWGSFIAMAIAIVAAICILVRSHLKYKAAPQEETNNKLFKQLCAATDKGERWQLLKQYVAQGNAEQLRFAAQCYQAVTTAFLQEEYRPLRHATHEIETAHKQLKRARKREIIGLRGIEPMLAIEKNTWYYLANSSLEQLLYSLKRINDTCCEHVGNNFSPVPSRFAYEFLQIQQQIGQLFVLTESLLAPSSPDPVVVSELSEEASHIAETLNGYGKQVIDSIQMGDNIESATVLLSVVQESQQILSCLRHMMEGYERFME